MRMGHARGALAAKGLLVAALVASGCGAPLAEVRVRPVQIGWSSEGRPITAEVVTVESPPYGPQPYGAATGLLETVLVFAAIHGDETVTEVLARRFLDELRERPESLRGMRVVTIPVANPDGLEQRSRSNSRGVDLNRNFPSRNWIRRGGRHGDTPASEPETEAIMEAMRRFRPARVLSIHAPLHCVNFDGPAEAIAQAMASACGYALRSSIGYPTPGSFGAWAGNDQGIPVVTLELRRRIRGDVVWAELGTALWEFLRG